MAETRQPVRGEMRGNVKPKITLRTAINRFHLNEAAVPPGTTYEWKRESVMGMNDTEHQINCEANGWVPVPPSRHPELMGSNPAKETVIRRGGLVLKERPVEYTMEAKRQEKELASMQIGSQIERLGLEGKRVAGKGIKRQLVNIEQDMMDA